jgi:hypothetical protein
MSSCLRALTLILALAAACSDSTPKTDSAAKSDTLPSDGIRYCTAADNPTCLTLQNGFFCCTNKGEGWDPVTQPDNCQFTSCWDSTAQTCTKSKVCRKSSGATGSHTVTLKNRTGQTIWIAAYSSTSSPLDVQGWDWKLEDGKDHDLVLPHGWDAGRIWARTGCTGTGAQLQCKNGDCKGQAACAVSGDKPVSLAELTLDGGKNAGQPDNYDVSFVDGWNFQITIEPKTKNTSCKTVGVCTSAPVCWSAGKWTPTGGTAPAGCLSPCEIKKDPKHCCKCDLTAGSNCTCGQDCCNHAGSYGCSPFYPTGSPLPENELCIPDGEVTRPDGAKLSRPESRWDDDARSYISNVQSACPDVYAWQFHDLTSLATCRDDPDPVNYVVTFKPSAI